jgi:hypothetical protein
MSDLPARDADENCNARKTDGSGYCQHSAGWGTDHTGVGRCKFHGGSTPDQERGIINDLEDGAEDAAVALRLRLKHVRQAVENDDADDIDWSQVDRLARTVFDRTGHGKTETKELTGEDGDAITVSSDVVTVTGDDLE